MNTIKVIAILILFPMMSIGQPVTDIESTLETVNIKTGKRKIILQEKNHFEAPNWSRDGKFFIINSNGKLYRVDRKGKDKALINTGSATRCNNDHGISPDGTKLVISNGIEKSPGNFSSAIFILPVEGGEPKLITENTPSYWHGWSPDGKTLSYVGMRNNDYDIYTIPVDGGDEKQVTFSPGLDDGPEYSPDGKHIYYNSYQTGRMQIWRIATNGDTYAQLTFDNYANWFPHPSPDGKYIVYISYIEDQKESHPFGKDVKLRIMNLKTGKIRDLTEVFFGGQGTINVPSWSPDSKMVAFVSYRSLEMGYSHQPAFSLKQQKLELDNGTQLLYTSLSPSRIPRNQKVPLVIALHWGWDRERPIPPWFGKDFLTGIIQPAFEDINPIIIAPDCPSDNWHNPVSENAVLALMNAVMKKYPVDSSRIFITGFSAGGIGTWYISSRHPELFSMAIPMACKPEGEWIRDWTNLPVYIIHGTNDELFPFSDVENIATELAGKKATIKLMKVENGSHYDSGRFIPSLKYSHIWYSELDKE